MQEASKAAGQGRGRAGRGPETDIQAGTEGFPGGLLRGGITA